MQKREKIYEGKAKIIYTTDDADLLIQYFKDDASAFDGKKKGSIREKGILNNGISSRIFLYLEEQGIKTHFIKKLSDREMLVRNLKIIPVEVVVRNVIAGSLSKRMGIAEGAPLKDTILEFYYKSDELGDPMLNEDHIRVFELATKEEVEILKDQAQKINDLLLAFLSERGIRLIDFKLEFGTNKDGIFLGDEITPDGCRLWDKETNEKMDKDRFRRDLGKIEESYQEVSRRICES